MGGIVPVSWLEDTSTICKAAASHCYCGYGTQPPSASRQQLARHAGSRDRITAVLRLTAALTPSQKTAECRTLALTAVAVAQGPSQPPVCKRLRVWAEAPHLPGPLQDRGDGPRQAVVVHVRLRQEGHLL